MEGNKKKLMKKLSVPNGKMLFFWLGREGGGTPHPTLFDIILVKLSLVFCQKLGKDIIPDLVLQLLDIFGRYSTGRLFL